MNSNPHYQLVADTIRFVAENQAVQPDLKLISSEMGVSPYHLQRTFQTWAGVSPKQFLRFLTREAAIERLKSGGSVLESALDSGLSGPGRLHDLLISTDALTPGEIRKHAAGVQLSFGFGESIFGRALVAWTQRGLSFLGFCDEFGRDRSLESLKAQWKNAHFVEDSETARYWLDRIFTRRADEPLELWLHGSAFQLKVWQALLAIPEGTHATYGQIAQHIGKPRAARAVGTAIGSNPIAWIIPCHRVIRQAGETGGYRWGGLTKKALIGFEVASVAR